MNHLFSLVLVFSAVTSYIIRICLSRVVSPFYDVNKDQPIVLEFGLP